MWHLSGRNAANISHNNLQNFDKTMYTTHYIATAIALSIDSGGLITLN